MLLIAHQLGHTAGTTLVDTADLASLENLAVIAPRLTDDALRVPLMTGFTVVAPRMDSMEVLP